MNHSHPPDHSFSRHRRHHTAQFTTFLLLLAALVASTPLLFADTDNHITPRGFTAAPTECQELIVNGNFEEATSGNWRFGQTAAPGIVVADPVHNGTGAVRLGIPSNGSNVETYSTVYQTVTIPTGTQQATLTYWERPGTSGDNNDYRTLLALRTDLTTLRLIERTNGSGDGQWVERTFDLTGLAGQTLLLYFNVFNDGTGSTLVSYLDDMSLLACDDTTAPTATPTNTVISPPPTATPTVVSTPAPIRVRAGTAQIPNGATTVDVPLDLVVFTDRVNVGVLSIDLQYDATMLKATQCTVSNAMELLLCNIDTPGRIQLAGISANGIRSEINLANLTFTLLQQVESSMPLAVTLDIVGNVDGSTVSADQQNGSITLLCPSDSENCTPGIRVYLPLVTR